MPGRLVRVLFLLLTYMLAPQVLAQTTTRIAFQGEAAPHVANMNWSFFESVGLNNQGQTLIHGWVKPPTTGASKSGLWMGTAGNLTKVAYSEPGLAETWSASDYLSIKDQVINDNGQVAFRLQNNYTIWRWTAGQNQRIAGPNDLLPGMPSGNRVLQIHNLAFNNAGRVAFRAYTWYSDNLSVGQWNNEGVWHSDGSQMSLVVREEDVVAELGMSFRYRANDAAPLLSNDGVVTFYDQIAGPYITWPSQQDNRDGTWAWSPGQTLRPIAVEGLAKQGIGGEVWDTTSRASSASGNVHAFTAWRPDVTRTGLYRQIGNGPAQLLASSRTQVAGRAEGVWFGSIRSVYINTTTDVAFVSYLTNSDALATTPINSTNNRAVFLVRAGEDTPKQIAAAGDRAPGTAEGTTFFLFDRELANEPGTLTMNNRGQIAFLALLSGNGVSSGNNLALYLTDLEDELHLIARTGDAFAYDPSNPSLTRIIKDIKVTLGSAGDDGVLRSLNDSGMLSYILTFSDNSTGVYMTSVPEPSVAAITIAIGVGLLRRRRCR